MSDIPNKCKRLAKRIVQTILTTPDTLTVPEVTMAFALALKQYAQLIWTHENYRKEQEASDKVSANEQSIAADQSRGKLYEMAVNPAAGYGFTHDHSMGPASCPACVAADPANVQTQVQPSGAKIVTVWLPGLRPESAKDVRD